MKLEAFEKASEIRRNINYLIDLDSLLANAACGHNLLAAINVEYDGDVTVKNQEKLSQEMLQAFRQIINTNVAQLRKEFEEL